MFGSILVPLDGSTFGEQALPLALSIARRAGASLQVVHVHVPLMPYDESLPAIDPRLIQQVREGERTYLDAVVERLSRIAPVPVTSALLEGPVAEALYEHTVTAGTNLVVLTTHGRGPLTRFWLGSVADELVRRLPMPILLVRPQEPVPDLAGEPVLQRMLIPLDGSEFAEQILEPAVALGSLMQAAFTLLWVIELGLGLPIDTEAAASTGRSGLGPSLFNQLQELQEQRQREAQHYLDTVADRLRARSLPVQTRVVANAQVAGAILDEARAQAIDLIALETHGRRGLTRLFLGSVADKVLRGASTPMLVHRPLGK